MIYIAEGAYKCAKLGVTIRFGDWSLIKGPDEMLGVESSS